MEGFLAIFSGVIAIAGMLFLSETYAPYLLRERAKLLQAATGKHYISALDEGKDISLKTQFKVALARPWQLLAREPIVVVLSLYIAVIYATLYSYVRSGVLNLVPYCTVLTCFTLTTRPLSFFSAFPLEFQVLRGWSPGIGGLAFLGILVGMLLSLVYVVAYENPRYVRKSDALGGSTPPPEERLPAAMVGSVLVVVGLAVFTGTNGPDVFWLAPIIASAPFGAGMVLLFLGIQNYLVDSYLVYSASVLAANSLIRSVLGAVFPLITDYMYNPVNCPLATCGIKVGAGISLALAFVCLPAPFVLFRKGAGIRRKCKYAAEAARIFDQMNKKESQREAEGEGHGGEGDVEKSGERVREAEREEQASPTETAHEEEREHSGSGSGKKLNARES